MKNEENALERFHDLVVLPSHRQPVVALVWGEQCAPCRSIKPKMIDLINKHSGKLCLVRAEDDMELVRALKVRSVPTVIVYSRGNEILRFTGDKPEDVLYTTLARVGTFQQPLPVL